MYQFIEPNTTPPPSKDQIMLDLRLSVACLGLIVGGGCMGAGNTGLYDYNIVTRFA